MMNGLMQRKAGISLLIAAWWGLTWMLLIGVVSPVWAQFRQPDVVKVETAWLAPQAKPGDLRALAIVLDLAEHYHINPATVADKTLIPTEVKVEGPGFLRIGSPQFPKPTQVTVNYTGTPQALDVHEGKVVVYVPVVVKADAPLGAAELKVSVRYQACDDTSCLMPKTVTLQPILDVTATPAEVAAGNPLFKDFDASVFGSLAEGKVKQDVKLDFFAISIDLDPSGAVGFVSLLLLALLGGVLLNFTPCVLPVIPIKMLGLSKSAGNRTRCLLLGAAMSLGVIGFWLGLGSAMAAVSGLTATNQLFQYPLFTIGVGVLIAVMAIGMGGFFTVRLPQSVYMIDPDRGSVTGSLLFGVMTAVLSTPCTAPFMGGAAAWAITQPAWVTLATFAAIGVGMALPYFLLAAFPQLIERMPRTGPASELIKQVMGLLMLAAAAYFIGTGLSGLLVNPPDPPSHAYWWAVMALIAAAGLWLAWRTLRIRPAMVSRVAFVTIGLMIAAGAAYGGVRLTDKGPIDWVYYTPERFERAKREGKVVVMDFTAEWCLNCKVLEATVLNREEVSRRLNGAGVVPMKVDLTGNNGPGNAMLGEVGRVAIPALVVFAPDGTQTLNSDAYTPQQVLDAVREADAKVARR